MPKIIVVDSCNIKCPKFDASTIRCEEINKETNCYTGFNTIHPDCPLHDASDLVSREAVMEIYEEWHNTRKTCAEDDADAGNRLGIKLGNLIKSMPSAFAEKGEK